MMSQQRSSLTSMFADDPFFSQERLLWPLNCEALSSLQEDFFNRRTKLADSLLAEFHDGTQRGMDLRQAGPFLRLPLRRSSNSAEPKAESPSKELREVAHHQKVTGNGDSGDLLVTLDARGYAPEDITVKLEGRSLAVVAVKQAGAEESQTSSCSSASSSCSSSSSSSSASSQTGFVQRINLPAHLDLSGLSCSLMDDGQLRIDAPAAKRPINAEEEEHRVPIRFRSSLEFPISKKTEDTHKD